MERKGQGAIEYLLIIGAAILVVAVVIIALVSVTTTAGDNTGEEAIVTATTIQACQIECLQKDGNWSGNKCSKYTSITCKDFNVPNAPVA